jgi:hypothetical protein
MKTDLDRQFAIGFAIWLLLLVAPNVCCWNPGTGGRTDVLPGGTRPVGSESETFVGYPATYLAQLWRTDIPDFPAPMPTVFGIEFGMTRVATCFSAAALMVDLVFCCSLLGIIIAFWYAGRRDSKRLAVSSAVVLGGVAMACYLAGDAFSTHL